MLEYRILCKECKKELYQHGSGIIATTAAVPELCDGCAAKKKSKQKAEESVILPEVISPEVISPESISPDLFKFWLHHSGDYIVYGVHIRWRRHDWLRGIVVNARKGSAQGMGVVIDEASGEFIEIPSNEFPPPKKRSSQALLWNDTRKHYDLPSHKFSDRHEIAKYISEWRADRLVLAEWPLVVNGEESWE